MTLFAPDPGPLPERGRKRKLQAAETGSPSLTPSEAVRMYREGASACLIAHAYAITRQGAESKIREGGLGGLQWCPLCGTHEELSTAA